jgi:uncharacterized protein
MHMDREAIFTALQEAEPELKSRGVRSLAVFGSVARGDFSQDSDLDILVVFDRPVGLFDFIRLKHFLEQLTRSRVDIVTPDALRPEMRKQILKEAVNVQ